ncbi:hypothetical protein M0811_11822 [Anaeramoeba ignava]|uniref:Uncharacterized protein n=1 Tax=Anaeramoeba ignava TaxID=1746090 RepID=A0A9Q0R6P1_ANAIG|nr:hypothetical protein M0811_11822 [Anaeramoeba ignava]
MTELLSYLKEGKLKEIQNYFKKNPKEINEAITLEENKQKEEDEIELESDNENNNNNNNNDNNDNQNDNQIPNVLESGLNPIQICSQLGHVHLLKPLVDLGADINSKSEYEQTALHLAARNGNTKCVTQLLDLNAEISPVNAFGETPLHISIANSHKAISQELILRKAVLDRMDSNGKTPLTLAASLGQVDVVSRILDSLEDPGSVINEADGNGWNSLHYAVFYKHMNCVEELVKRGADVGEETGNFCQAMHLAAQQGWKEGLGFLIKNKADVNAISVNSLLSLGKVGEDENFENQEVKKLAKKSLKNKQTLGREEEYDPEFISTPLHFACRYGQHEAAEFLISQGANVDQRNKFGAKSMHIAAKYGHVECISVLVRNNANVDDQDFQNYTAIFYAVREGHRNVVEKLISLGTDAKHVDDEQWNLIHLAAFFGHAQIITMLIDLGVDSQAQTARTQTPLHIAANEKNEECVQVLVEALKKQDDQEDPKKDQKNQKHGIDTTTKAGWTALHFAAKAGSLSVVKFLAENGADIHQTTSYQSNAAHLAAQEGHEEVLGYLIDKGCDPNVKNQGQAVALHLAVVGNMLSCVRMLLERGADVNAQDKNGDTPSSSCSYVRHGRLRFIASRSWSKHKAPKHERIVSPPTNENEKEKKKVVIVEEVESTQTGDTLVDEVWGKIHSFDETIQFVKKCAAIKKDSIELSQLLLSLADILDNKANQTADRAEDYHVVYLKVQELMNYSSQTQSVDNTIYPNENDADTNDENMETQKIEMNMDLDPKRSLLHVLLNFGFDMTLYHFISIFNQEWKGIDHNAKQPKVFWFDQNAENKGIIETVKKVCPNVSLLGNLPSDPQVVEDNYKSDLANQARSISTRVICNNTSAQTILPLLRRQWGSNIPVLIYCRRIEVAHELIRKNGFRNVWVTSLDRLCRLFAASTQKPPTPLSLTEFRARGKDKALEIVKILKKSKFLKKFSMEERLYTVLKMAYPVPSSGGLFACTYLFDILLELELNSTRLMSTYPIGKIGNISKIIKALGIAVLNYAIDFDFEMFRFLFQITAEREANRKILWIDVAQKENKMVVRSCKHVSVKVFFPPTKKIDIGVKKNVNVVDLDAAKVFVSKFLDENLGANVFNCRIITNYFNAKEILPYIRNVLKCDLPCLIFCSTKNIKEATTFAQSFRGTWASTHFRNTVKYAKFAL